MEVRNFAKIHPFGVFGTCYDFDCPRAHAGYFWRFNCRIPSIYMALIA